MQDMVRGRRRQDGRHGKRGGGGQDARHDKRGEGKMQDMVRGGEGKMQDMVIFGKRGGGKILRSGKKCPPA